MVFVSRNDMDSTNFSVQGRGRDDEFYLEFFFERGPVTELPPREPFITPGGAAITQPRHFHRSESVYASTRDRERREIMMALLYGPQGNVVAPGIYSVLFESYTNWDRGFHIDDVATIPGFPVAGTVTIEYQGTECLAYCSLPEDAVASFLMQAVASAWHHKDNRIADRSLQINDMLSFIDHGTYIRTAQRFTSIFGKLFDTLQISSDPVATVFKQSERALFDVTEFGSRLKKPHAIVYYHELRAWLDVEHETLNRWLEHLGLKRPEQSARTCQWTVAQITTVLIPHLQSKVDKSPIGDKINAALQAVGLAP